MNGDALSVRAEPMLPTQESNDVATILRLAVERGSDVDTLERMVSLYERIETRRAESAFNTALAAFQAECPPIAKTSTAKVATKSGGSYSYKYAELDQIATVTRPLLTKHGLSYSWDSAMEGGSLVCHCTLRHAAGHKQSASFTTPTESLATGMSAQQMHASALTYARRQSLIQVLGLTTTDADSDSASMERIKEAHVAEIESLIVKVKADRAKVLAHVGVTSFSDMLMRDLPGLREALRAKGKEVGAA